jgi:hypothetical protein
VAGGGEPEWVVQNYPVSVTPGGTTATPPAFAFANGNRLPDGAWARFALTSEMVTGTDWDGTGTFDSGEVEDHIIGLPLAGGKCIPLLVVTNDGPYKVPGAGGLVLCTVTVTNLRDCAGSFNWTLRELNGDVDCAPQLGGPVAIGAVGAGGDKVDIIIDATNGTKDSQWLFTAIAVDPDAVVTDEGITAGCSGESETTLEFTTTKVSLYSMDGTHVCGTPNCEIHVEVEVRDSDGNEIDGATVTLEMTAPDGSKVTMEVTTDHFGIADAIFPISSHGTYEVEVIDITGDGMEYAIEDNLVNPFVSVD